MSISIYLPEGMDSHKWIAVTSETMLESVAKLMIISHFAGSALSLTMLNHAPVHRKAYFII